ncbi:MAG TPA: hypothetical protein VHS31_18200 [Tepidisphaeraceae bacterium]|jgi:hypothetical protein|nr:hypothetical protein [Tepidisphaeraceae bacterium]
MRWILPFIVLWAVGCTHFEYDLTEPTDIATHIGTKTDTTIKLDPLEYRFRAYDDHLIVQIFNPTEDSIQLMGDQSAVVDPQGQSHPLRGATMEPHSFIKLILPPPPPVIQPTGPSIGIGLGYVATQSRYRRDPFYRAHFYDSDYPPQYYVLYDEGDSTYWNWRGEMAVRLSLTFQENGKTISHKFSFTQVKVK